MKFKIILIFLFLTIKAFCLDFVTDEANVLSSDFKHKLTKILQEESTENNTSIYIATLTSIKNSQYLSNFEKQIQNKKAMFIFLDAQRRKIWIGISKSIKDMIDDEKLREIVVYYAIPKIKRGEFEDAMSGSVENIQKLLRSEYKTREEVYDFYLRNGFFLFLGFLLLGVIVKFINPKPLKLIISMSFGILFALFAWAIIEIYVFMQYIVNAYPFYYFLLENPFVVCGIVFALFVFRGHIPTKESKA